MYNMKVNEPSTISVRDDLSISEYVSSDRTDLNQEEEETNVVFNPLYAKDSLMADSEKENGICIENINLLEKQIFEYFEKKAFNNFNDMDFKDLKLRNKSTKEESTNINTAYEENIKINKEYDDQENYLNLLNYENESVDNPFSKKDLKENFFYYSNKIHLLNEFDSDENDNLFKSKNKKHSNKELKMNILDNKLNLSGTDRKTYSILKDKISDFVIDKIEKDLTHLEEE